MISVIVILALITSAFNFPLTEKSSSHVFTQFEVDEVEPVRTVSVREETNVFSKQNFNPRQVKGDHQVTDTLDSSETQNDHKIVNTNLIQAHLDSNGTYKNEHNLKTQIKNSFEETKSVQGIDFKAAEPLDLTSGALQPASILSVHHAYSGGQYINPVVVPPEGFVSHKIITPIEPLEARQVEREPIAQPVIHQGLTQDQQVYTITPYVYHDYHHGPILEIRHV